MLRFTVIFLLATSAFATTDFDADYERSLQVIKQSKETRAELAKDINKREVASTDQNVIEGVGTLEEFMETAEHDLD